MKFFIHYFSLRFKAIPFIGPMLKSVRYFLTG